MLIKQLEEIRSKREEKRKAETDKIKQEVISKLNEIGRLIDPYIKADDWSWRSSPQMEGLIAAIELQPKEAKPIVISSDFRELVVNFIKSKPDGVTIADIAKGLVDAKGEPRYAEGSLRPKLPILVSEKILKTLPNPINKKQLLYFVV